jgi:hypothetical protein
MIDGLTAVVALLQASGRPSDTVLLALQAYEFVGAAIGVFIAALAYRGYRRNDSRPMLFVAIGFALALGVPLVIGVGYLLLPVTGWQVAIQVLSQTVEIAGLLCIVYGLWA